MKRNFIFFVLICLLFNLNTAKLSAQWTPTGPEGGYIECSTASGDTLFTVAGNREICSLYASYDRGNTWTNITGPQLPTNINAILLYGNSLFVGCGSSTPGSVGVYRSDDYGITWDSKTNIESSVRGFTASGSTLYAITSWNGILRSTDNGEHWTNVTHNLPDNYFEGGLLATPAAVFVSIGDYNGVWRSTNSGNTWEKVSDGIDPYAIVLTMAAVGNDIYAGTDAFGLYKSSDNGRNWTNLDPSVTTQYWDYQFIAGDSTTLFAATYRSGMLRSTDQGNNWSPANNGMDIYDQPASLYKTGEDFIVGTKGGMYRTSDQGDHWSEANTGIYAHNSRAPILASIDTNLFTGSFHSGIFRSTDQGNNWTNVSEGLPVNVDILQTYSVGSSTLFAYDKMSTDMGNSWIPTNSPGGILIEHKNGLFAFNPVEGVYRSMDFGANWTNVTSTLYSNAYGTLLATDSTLLLGTIEGAYYSVDNGDSWLPSTFQDVSHPTAIVNLTSNGATHFCGLVNYGTRGIYKSTDNLATWTKVHDLLVTKIVISGNNVFASGTNLEYINNEWIEVASIVASQDNGIHWSKISAGIGDALFPLSLAAIDSKVFIAMASAPDYNIYYSGDFGATWLDAGQGLPERTFATLMTISDDEIYAGTYAGSLWHRNLSAFELPAQPDAIIGQANPCTGSSQTYTITNVPEVIYTWQFPSDWTITSGAGTNSVTVTVGTASGIALVTPSTVPGNGPAQFLVVSPSLPANPAVSVLADDENVCAGTTVTFTATPAEGGDTPAYQWFVNDVASENNQAVFAFVPSNNDKVKVVMTSSLECVTNNPATSNEITVQVTNTPEVSWTTFAYDNICINWEPVALSGAMPAGGIYSGNGVTNTMFDPVAAGTGTHEISYVYTDANNCSNVTSRIITVLDCLGIEELKSELLVYPNPATDNFTIRLPENQTIAEINLFNNMGLEVVGILNIKPSGSIFVPVHHLPAGNYILKVISDQKTYVKTIIIQ
ncbi:MAG: T9SS type A sorting domain-containing protein [Bacteroidales bacterium]|nr:T9SS type A sorting domain-containing protein [Bacteroidales bacterium]